MTRIVEKEESYAFKTLIHEETSAKYLQNDLAANGIKTIFAARIRRREPGLGRGQSTKPSADVDRPSAARGKTGNSYSLVACSTLLLFAWPTPGSLVIRAYRPTS